MGVKPEEGLCSHRLIDITAANLGYTKSYTTIAILLTHAGFAMNYGVFQEYYQTNLDLQGGRALTGIIGTTSNGVM